MWAAQKVELKADTVVHVGKVDAAVYPLAKKKTSYEFLREKAHLRPRTNTIGAFSWSCREQFLSVLGRLHHCANLHTVGGRKTFHAVHDRHGSMSPLPRTPSLLAMKCLVPGSRNCGHP